MKEKLIHVFKKESMKPLSKLDIVKAFEMGSWKRVITMELPSLASSEWSYFPLLVHF